jgi:hypothetical protein
MKSIPNLVRILLQLYSSGDYKIKVFTTSYNLEK